MPTSLPSDNINHPKHYTEHPSGVECITITEHMSFNLGNAMKYIWRADLKNGLEDLKKAEWYIKREIDKRLKELENQHVKYDGDSISKSLEHNAILKGADIKLSSKPTNNKGHPLICACCG